MYLYTAPGQTRIKQVSFKQVTYSFRNPMQSWENEWTSLLIRLQLQCAGDDGLLISKKNELVIASVLCFFELSSQS